MLRPRLTYANVVSSLALFLALGGTSYAVAKLPKGSVGERELKKNAVTSEKVRDGSLTATDLASGTLLSGPRGPRGPEGSAGTPGARGPSDILFQPHGGTALSRAASTPTVTAKLVDVPAGDWLFTGVAQLIFGGPSADWFNCQLQFGSQGGTSASVSRLGRGYSNPADPSHPWADDATMAATATVQEAFRITGPTTVSLRCSHHGAIGDTADQPRADYATLSAIRTDHLVVQP